MAAFSLLSEPEYHPPHSEMGAQKSQAPYTVEFPRIIRNFMTGGLDLVTVPTDTLLYSLI